MSKLYQYDDMMAFSALASSKALFDEQISNDIKEKINLFAQAIDAGSFPAFSVVNREEDLPALHLLVENWKQHFENVIVVGVGGSSLGAQALVEFQGKYVKSELNLYFLDNVDAYSFETLLQKVNLRKTVVLSVSKSGSTIETLSQTLLFINELEKQNLPVNMHVVGLTEEKQNPLRTLLDQYSVPILNHPNDVGGRFTVFTLVGLIAGIVKGMDVFKLRQGALSVLKGFVKSPLKSHAYNGALLSVGHPDYVKPIQYMIPYTDRLNKMSEWFVQLWAESLGKDGEGTTPVAAVGSTDQHSALQLLMDGPKDKLVTLIVSDSLTQGEHIPVDLAKRINLPYLESLNLGKLIYHQAQGTADALSDAGVPVRVFYTKTLDEEVLGALLMHFMLETAVAGLMLEVNTWNQPGVEDGKKRTLSYLQSGAH